MNIYRREERGGAPWWCPQLPAARRGADGSRPWGRTPRRRRGAPDAPTAPPAPAPRRRCPRPPPVSPPRCRPPTGRGGSLFIPSGAPPRPGSRPRPHARTMNPPLPRTPPLWWSAPLGGLPECRPPGTIPSISVPPVPTNAKVVPKANSSPRSPLPFCPPCCLLKRSIALCHAVAFGSVPPPTLSRTRFRMTRPPIAARTDLEMSMHSHT